MLYVTYASSLTVTVIDWDKYMGAPGLPAAPFLRAHGVRLVPHRVHPNFTEDTVTSLAVLPAAANTCKHCEKKGRFRLLVLGTAKGQVRECGSEARRRCCMSSDAFSMHPASLRSSL